MSTSNNHNHHVTDEQLDRHADALRNDPVPEDGPSPQALGATLAMLRAESSSRPSIVMPGRRSFIGRIVAMSTTQRIAATVLVTLGALTLYVMFTLFSSFGASTTLGAVVEKFKAAQTIQYTTSVTLAGKSVKIRTMMSEPGSRMRSEMPDGTVSIMDGSSCMILDPKTKTAKRTNLTGLDETAPPAGKDASLVAAFRSLSEKKGESLGERIIDDVETVGFKTEMIGREITIWADKKTAHPVRIEMAMEIGGQNTTMVMDDFIIDAPLDDNLFSLDPPPDYKLEENEMAMPDLGDIAEEVADLLRMYTDKSEGGVFPPSLLDWTDFFKVIGDRKAAPVAPPKDLPMKIGGISGTLYSRPDSFGYAGKGVKRGDKDKIVFWFQPEKSKTYRAVFGDLRIEDITADKLPAKQPMSKPATETVKESAK